MFILTRMPVLAVRNKTQFIKDRAIIIISNYKFKSSEQLLDQYLIEHFNKGLKECCLALLNAIKVTGFNLNEATDLTITFNTPEADKLASLITYGDGAIQGSKILKQSLGQGD